MAVDIFAECKARLTAEEVARTYGLEFDRRGRNARCIFHPDHHPSMSFKAGRYRCWSCGATGTAIDLTMRIFNLTALEAVRRLNDDFHLGLPLDRQQTPAERKDIQKRQEMTATYRQFEEWRSATLDKLNACFRLAHLALKEGLTDREALAVKWQAAIEYWADCLLSGDIAEEMSIFRDRKVVNALCSRILNDTQAKSEVA